MQFQPWNIIVLVGCAFVTFRDPTSALKAQDDLHDKQTLPGVSKKLQQYKNFMFC